jgi:hypothetical protein
MSPFSAPFFGASKSEGCCFQSERLLYQREPDGVRAEPGKQKLGARRAPTQSAALRLLTIAKKRPAAPLEFVA